MRASSKHPQVESSTGAASQPSTSGDLTAKEYVDPTAAIDPPPTSSSSDAALQILLETVMTVQAAQG